MTNLPSTPTIIYTATTSITVTISTTITGRTNLTMYSNSTTYYENTLRIGNTSDQFILSIGDVIIASSSIANSTTYQVLNSSGVDITPIPTSDTSLSSIISTAQNAVGVKLANLTTNEQLALMAILLYKAGGVNPVTLAVKPLNQWVN